MGMLVTNHVLSGALIGGAVRRPLPAFTLGVVSHFALDAVPHWGKFGSLPGGMLRVAVPDGLAGLAVIGAFAAIATSPPASAGRNCRPTASEKIVPSRIIVSRGSFDTAASSSSWGKPTRYFVVKRPSCGES